MIDSYWLKTIFDYISELDKWYLFYSYLTYYCFVRPKEICGLRFADFDFDRQILTIPGHVSKNGKTQIVTIPGKVSKLLLELKYFNYSQKIFICSISLKPGIEQRDPRYIAKKWARIRKKLNFPKEYQFYSLKDTGIVKMLRAGVSPEIVRDQARHYSLEVTNRYIQIANEGANQQILDKIDY